MLIEPVATMQGKHPVVNEQWPGPWHDTDRHAIVEVIEHKFPFA